VASTGKLTTRITEACGPAQGSTSLGIRACRVHEYWHWCVNYVDDDDDDDDDDDGGGGDDDDDDYEGGCLS
jgi:hypothetical protein